MSVRTPTPNSVVSALDNARIWGDSISERLTGARVLNDSGLAEVLKKLCDGCPVQPWPYGNVTSINPLLVTLGPSPGASPNPADSDLAGQPIELPTAGVRHPRTKYKDGRGYWSKIRLLVRTVVQAETKGSEKPTDCEDSYALFGNMNLDPYRSGKASDVKIDENFGRWVLRTIRDGLRPKYLICLGLTGRPEARELLEQIFNIDTRQPDHTCPLNCYEEKRFVFKEWDYTDSTDNLVKLVFWPQHPSRPPFARDIGNWRGACEEFATRHHGFIRP